MMDEAGQRFDVAREKVAADVHVVIEDCEELLKSVASASGAGFSAMRAGFEEKLTRARDTLAQASRPVIEGVSRTTRAVDAGVRSEPWVAVALAGAVGVLIGFLAARR